jgi:hypothetical protein
MFRSSTIIRELALNLAKVIFMLKYSVKLSRYLLYGCVAVHRSTTFYIHDSMHRNSILIRPNKMQLCAGIYLPQN